MQDIQRGELEKVGQLWKMVKDFIAFRAVSYSRRFLGSTVDIDDLIQEGFLSVCEALETYRADGGRSFPTYLDYYLRGRWRRLYGLDKHEPLNKAQSLYEPVDDGETPLLDTIPDEAAAEAFSRREDCIVNSQLRQELEKALDHAPNGEIIRRRYFNGETAPEIAANMGVSPEDVYRMERAAIRYLQRGPYTGRLRDFDFYHGTGLMAWKNTGMSIQERYIFKT